MEEADSSLVKEDIDSPACEAGDDSKQTLSKRQQKLLKKRQEWLSHSEERRQARKTKRKEKRRIQVESGANLGPTRKMLKRNMMKDSKCDVTVVIDLSFDDLMVDKDICKLVQQIQYCYSRNRRAPEPLKFYISSLGAKSRQRLETVGDYQNWDVCFSSESYTKLFDLSQLVYLTSDSPNQLQSLESGKVYIIGGLVDHNHHKGICFDTASKLGIAHARLPIDEYCKLNTRQVLTVNHVFEILLRFTECHSWHDAFYNVIPKRKQAGEPIAVSRKPDVWQSIEGDRPLERTEGQNALNDPDCTHRQHTVLEKQLELYDGHAEIDSQLDDSRSNLDSSNNAENAAPNGSIASEIDVERADELAGKCC